MKTSFVCLSLCFQAWMAKCAKFKIKFLKSLLLTQIKSSDILNNFENRFPEGMWNKIDLRKNSNKFYQFTKNFSKEIEILEKQILRN